MLRGANTSIATSRSRRAVLLPAALLLIAAVSVNKWSVEQIVIPDRYLESTTHLLAIAAGQVLLLMTAIYLIWRRPGRLTSGRSVAAAALVAPIALGGVFGSVRAAQPPRWQLPGLSMVERLDEIARTTSTQKLELRRWQYDYKLRWALYKLRASIGMVNVSEMVNLRLTEADYLLERGDTQQAIDAFESLRADTQARQTPEERRELRDLLGVAYLRLGEQQNCIERHGVGMCYLPLPASGVHTVEFGSRRAIAHFEEALNENPDGLSNRWLLNLAYMTLGEYPDKVPPRWLIPPEAFKPEFDIKRFRDVAPALGLDVLTQAGGSILEDFDGDGYLDLMISGTGLNEQMQYFHNNGDGTFNDRTQAAGLIGERGGLNMSHADYNNDGHPDVLVVRGAWMLYDSGEGNHPDSLLRNNGDGTFTDVTEAAGLLSFHPAQVAVWADYDNDGWVDLLIGNESWPRHTHPLQLFHNNGDGTFTDVAAKVGITAFGETKGAAWGDYNNDGLQDLYVSILGKPNVLYRNNGKGPGGWTFTDVTREAGVAEPVFSFPTWFWDFDNDGWLDLFVAGFGGSNSGPPGGMAASPDADIAALYLGLPLRFSSLPRLYRNNHDGTFADVTASAGLNRVIHVMGSNYGDLDNDGFLDMYLGTGSASYRSLLPNRMFRSVEGRTFQDVTSSAGVGHLQKGHGVAFGDIDNDGDQDIYEEMGGWFPGDGYQNVLYENPGHGNHWVTLRLQGVKSNRAAIGSRIRVVVATASGDRDIQILVGTGGSFGSSSLQQEIGLGQATAIRRIEIKWAGSQSVQVFENVAMDQIVAVREGDAALTPVHVRTFALAPVSSEDGQSSHTGRHGVASVPTPAPSKNGRH